MSDPQLEPPTGLNERGLMLWHDVLARWSLRPDEVELLRDACHEATVIDLLQAEQSRRPLVTTGSKGQDAPAPWLVEMRLHRLTFASLLRRLKLPDENSGDVAASAASQAGRALVNARWRRPSG